MAAPAPAAPPATSPMTAIFDTPPPADDRGGHGRGRGPRCRRTSRAGRGAGGRAGGRCLRVRVGALAGLAASRLGVRRRREVGLADDGLAGLPAVAHLDVDLEAARLHRGHGVHAGAPGIVRERPHFGLAVPERGEEPVAGLADDEAHDCPRHLAVVLVPHLDHRLRGEPLGDDVGRFVAVDDDDFQAIRGPNWDGGQRNGAADEQGQEQSHGPSNTRISEPIPGAEPYAGAGPRADCGVGSVATWTT